MQLEPLEIFEEEREPEKFTYAGDEVQLEVGGRRSRLSRKDTIVF